MTDIRNKLRVEAHLDKTAKLHDGVSDGPPIHCHLPGIRAQHGARGSGHQRCDAHHCEEAQQQRTASPSLPPGRFVTPEGKVLAQAGHPSVNVFLQWSLQLAATLGK